MVRGWRWEADVGSVVVVVGIVVVGVVDVVVIVVIVVRGLVERCGFRLEGVAVGDIWELL